MLLLLSASSFYMYIYPLFFVILFILDSFIVLLAVIPTNMILFLFTSGVYLGFSGLCLSLSGCELYLVVGVIPNVFSIFIVLILQEPWLISFLLFNAGFLLTSFMSRKNINFHMLRYHGQHIIPNIAYTEGRHVLKGTSINVQETTF